jgi:hypothetical protein
MVLLKAPSLCLSDVANLVLYMTMGWESNRLSRHTIPLNYKRKTAKRKILGLPYLKSFNSFFV